jgi:hypothetical protein
LVKDFDQASCFCNARELIGKNQDSKTMLRVPVQQLNHTPVRRLGALWKLSALHAFAKCLANVAGMLLLQPLT